MLVFGRVGDMLGYRRIFLAGSLWSAVAFVLCALAPSYGFLLVARVLQGVGAALVLSCGPALATSLHSEVARTRVLGIYTMVIGIGGALGPLIAGMLVPLIGWPAVFWFRAPLALSAFLLAWLLPADTRPAHREKFDAAGGALLVLAISAMLLALNQLQNLGSYRLWFVAAAFACVLATGGFIMQERRTQRPIIDLRYLQGSRLLAAERRTCGAQSRRVLRAAAGPVLFEPSRWIDGLRNRSAARLLACRHRRCGTARGAARGTCRAAVARTAGSSGNGARAGDDRRRRCDAELPATGWRHGPPRFRGRAVSGGVFRYRHRIDSPLRPRRRRQPGHDDTYAWHGDRGDGY